MSCVQLQSRETSVIGALGCIFVQNITKEGFQYKPLLFFLFWDLDFIHFLGIFGGIHEYFCMKTWKPWVVFMKSENQKILKPIWCLDWALRPQLRPPPRASRGAEAGAEAWGPSLGTKWVSIFFDFRFSWNHPRFQVFMQKYSWNHQKLPKNEWNQVTKKKERLLFKTPLVVIFSQKTAIFGPWNQVTKKKYNQND